VLYLIVGLLAFPLFMADDLLLMWGCLWQSPCWSPAWSWSLASRFSSMGCTGRSSGHGCKAKGSLLSVEKPA